MSSTLAIFAKCFANDIATMFGVTLLYKLVFTPAVWSGILSLWRPWSDLAFTMVATFVVHELMYFGPSPWAVSHDAASQSSILLPVRRCAGVNSLFLWVAKLGWLSKYKLYRGPTQEPSADLLKRTIKVRVRQCGGACATAAQHWRRRAWFLCLSCVLVWFGGQENLIGHGITQWIGLYVLAKGFEMNGSSLDDDLPDFWTAYVQVWSCGVVFVVGGGSSHGVE
jgi:hypothetical protein